MKRITLLLVITGISIFTIERTYQAKGFGGGITLIGADGSNTHFVAESNELNNLVSNVFPRFQFQYADNNKDYLVGSLAFALQNLIMQTEARIIFLFADSNREMILGYPTELINDATAPQVTNITASSLTSTSAKITWTTNEFATSLLKYGTQSGTYPQTVTDDTYQKLHQNTLSGLTTGTKYYYRIVNTDRSGNVFQTAEKTFTVASFVYLPLITR